MSFLRSALFNLGMVIWTLGMGIVGLPTLIGPRSWRLKISEIWCAGMLAWARVAAGISWEIRGRENLPDGPVLVAFKHQSAWETYLLNQLLRDPAIVLKQELLGIPLVGSFLKSLDMIVVDRAAGASALRRMVADAKAALAKGRPIAIFPEGTRGAVGEALPYQPGLGALYTQLGVPLVGVALNSGLFWGRNAFTKKSGRVLVEILPAIPPGSDRRKALAALEAGIEEATARLVAEG